MLAVGFDRQRNVLLSTLLDTFDNSTPELRALAEKFRLHQSSVGLPAPHIVRTMAEAERLLGLGPLAFEAADTSWLGNDRAKAV